MKPETFSDYGKARYKRLVDKYPEFGELFKIKEYLRNNFFESAAADDAKNIADTVEAKIPNGPIYRPLKTYFKTLNRSELTPYIYDYFTDPIGQRFSNAAMEEFNRDVKEINRKAKGLTPDVLRYKVLFGNIIFHHKEKHLTRKELDLTLTYYYNNRSVANLISFNNQKFVNMAAKYGIISSASGATPYFVMGSRLYKDIPNSRWAEFFDALVETENEPEPAVKLYEPYPVFAPFPIANGDQLSDPVAFAILAEDVDAMTADKVKMDYLKFDEPKYENKLYLPTGLPSYPPEYV